MPPTTARRAPARDHAGARRPAAVPRHHRRVSGPVARPVRPVALPQPARRGSTGAFERLRALPEHRVVDRLLRGRAWIWLIGLMLGGIVAMQVSLLGLNAGISANVEKAGTLERVNADLETQVARLSSGARIRHTAQEEGMVAPPAGEVTFLTARPADDARLAAGRMQPPSDEARQVMATGGRPIVPPAPTTTLAPAAGDVAPVLATDPVLPEAAPVATATPAPVATAVPTPAPTAAPEAQVPAATGTGVTTAPAG